MRTIDGKDLKFLIVNISDPARDVAGFAVPGIDHGIAISGKPGLAGRELFQTTERKPRLVSELLLTNQRRQQVAHDRHGQGNADNTVKKHSQFHKSCASGHSVLCTHRGPPLAGFIEAVGYGWPGNCGRWLESHATTSEMSCGDMGRPSTSPRQSGAPSSGRPAITIVRSCWSLTRARNEPFTIELALLPPRPPAPWQEEQ